MNTGLTDQIFQLVLSIVGSTLPVVFAALVDLFFNVLLGPLLSGIFGTGTTTV